jgi:hypothetical protein
MITGTLIQAGVLTDANGDCVHGLLIDCGQESLRSAALVPLYRDVVIMTMEEYAKLAFAPFQEEKP